MKHKDFYRAFEERYYAPREIIKKLRKQYSPFVEPLKWEYENGKTYDMGCGRGEWLELMQEAGFEPFGVDLDDGMLEACFERNLPASKGDAVEHLKTLESESHIIISAFHVVEHISFDDLQTLVSESLRVLKPGGLLILETPNPENLKVATENFYLDPTHIRPIPSGLLSFLPEYHGFARTKVLRLQESKDLSEKEDITFSNLIEGASPDYAVVAQKKASDDVMASFDAVFSQEFGLSLTTLAEKFETRLSNLESHAHQAAVSANEAQAKANEAQARANEAEAKASEAEAKASEAEAKANEAEARTREAWQNYYMVINSTSWKMMKPLRLGRKAVRWFLVGGKAWLTFSPTSRPRRVLRELLISSKHRINANPKFKMRIMKVLNRFPKLKARLKRVGMMQSSMQAMYRIDAPEQLSPRAKKIYHDLKEAIERKKETV